MRLMSVTQFFLYPAFFDDSAYIRYILPGRSSGEEYITDHKTPFTAGCNIFGGKNRKETSIVFSN